MGLDFLDYYHPYSGLCNQLYFISNHIYDSYLKKNNIYIHKINIDVFKKCRVPAGEVLDLVLTNRNLTKLLGYPVIELLIPKTIGTIPKLCIYPVISVEILNCLEFHESIVSLIPKVEGGYYGIHFRLEIDVIIHYL